MIQNAALDVAIGLALMYLMLSLLCTIINEYISSKLGLRAASLASGLKEILDDPTIRQKFYGHGLIAGSINAVAKGDSLLVPLIWNRGNLQAAVDTKVPATAATAPVAAAVAAPPKDHPSYISSTNFALAVLGTLDAGKPIPLFADVQAAVTAMNPSHLRSALLSALTGAQGDLDQFRKNVATWFDDSMERLSGAYKRHLKLISIVIGVVVAILFNADSFRVATTLWTDPDLRAQVVATATETVKEGIDSTANKIDEKKLQDAVARTGKLRSLPIGWPCDQKDGKDGKDAWLLPCIVQSLPSVTLSQILGWLLTAAALSLGAPFWFDLLSKLINIRGSGVKPERADAKRG
jgi:hypothetical protein